MNIELKIEYQCDKTENRAKVGKEILVTSHMIIKLLSYTNRKT